MARQTIPRSHPRYHSLIIRERLVEGFESGIVVPQGLIAHGRGEAFDYLLGEKSHEFAVTAERAAVAGMLLARKPVISVNGNYAALAAEYIVELANKTGAAIEVNLFYRTEERVKKIAELLKSYGAELVLGPGCETTRVPGLESPRGIVCKEGIWEADFVLVAIEDGDRTESLVRLGKRVAAIDLNPFSRTARAATITIVDEAVRATRNMIKLVDELKPLNRRELESILSSYDNSFVLKLAVKRILERLLDAAIRGLVVEPPSTRGF